MTTHTAAAGTGLPEPSHTLDDIQNDLFHLYHLLDAAVTDLIDAPRSPESIGYLDRVGAFLWIARDMAQAAANSIPAVRS